jgi:hypothetical protein
MSVIREYEEAPKHPESREKPAEREKPQIGTFW